MSEEEFNAADMECERVVNPRTAYRRRIAAEEAQRNAALQPINAEWAAIGKQPRYRVRLNPVLSAAARACVGLMFLGAVSRSLMDPLFGLALALSCFAWAIGNYLRGRWYG